MVWQLTVIVWLMLSSKQRLCSYGRNNGNSRRWWCFWHGLIWSNLLYSQNIGCKIWKSPCWWCENVIDQLSHLNIHQKGDHRQILSQHTNRGHGSPLAGIQGKWPGHPVLSQAEILGWLHWEQRKKQVGPVWKHGNHVGCHSGIISPPGWQPSTSCLCWIHLLLAKMSGNTCSAWRLTRPLTLPCWRWQSGQSSSQPCWGLSYRIWTVSSMSSWPTASRQAASSSGTLWTLLCMFMTCPCMPQATRSPSWSTRIFTLIWRTAATVRSTGISTATQNGWGAIRSLLTYGALTNLLSNVGISWPAPQGSGYRLSPTALGGPAPQMHFFLNGLGTTFECSNQLY